MRTPSSRVAGAVASITLAGFLLVALASAQQNPAAIPDSILYRALFQDIDRQEDFANRLQAGGHEHKRMRAQIREKAGLTVEEDVFLKNIAHAALQQQLQARLQADEIRRRYPEEMWIKRTAPREDAAQIAALYKKEQDAIMEAVARYRERFGGDRFSVLDRYARTVVVPTIGIKWFTGSKP